MLVRSYIHMEGSSSRGRLSCFKQQFPPSSAIIFSVHEPDTISNLLLTSTLNYCLLAHDLPQSRLHSLQNSIWSSIARISALSFATSPEDKFSPYMACGNNQLPLTKP